MITIIYISLYAWSSVFPNGCCCCCCWYKSELQQQNIKLNRKFNVWWNMKYFQFKVCGLASLEQENWKASFKVKSDFGSLDPTFTVYTSMVRYFFLIMFAFMPENGCLVDIYMEWMCNIVSRIWKISNSKLMEVIKFARVGIYILNVILVHWLMFVYYLVSKL